MRITRRSAGKKNNSRARCGSIVIYSNPFFFLKINFFERVNISVPVGEREIRKERVRGIYSDIEKLLKNNGYEISEERKLRGFGKEKLLGKK